MEISNYIDFFVLSLADVIFMFILTVILHWLK